MTQSLNSAASTSQRSTRKRARVALTAIAALTLTSAAAIPATHAATPAGAANEWKATVETFDTGVRNGYQLAFDSANRKVYFSDAKWRAETRTIVRDAAGNAIGGFVTADPGTGKLVEFDAASKSLVRNYSYLNIERSDGSGAENTAFDWSTTAFPTNTAATQSKTSMRSAFSPYGVAVDGTTTNQAGEIDPTFVTVTARGRDTDDGDSYGYGGNIVITSASQGAPTSADRVFKFDDGTPIFEGARRIAVNTKTHQAFVTNLGDSRGSGGDGFVAVLDLTKRGAEAVVARIALPGDQTDGKSVGVVGVAVDETTNTVYAGAMAAGADGTQLWAIDANNLNASNPKDRTLNENKVTRLDTQVGSNARPTFNPVTKKVYVSSYDAKTITVVEADKASANYGKTVKVIETGPTNSVEVDGERGLLYSANLGDREVVVFDIKDGYREVLSVPTSGNAVNLGIDPVTRAVWVSNFADSGKTDVFTVTAPTPVQPEPNGPGGNGTKPSPNTGDKALPAKVIVQAKKVSAKKRGKVTVKLRSAKKLAKTKGKVTVTLTKGKVTKKVSVKIKAGKGTKKLPKLARGTWKVKAKWSGNAKYKAAKIARTTLKVTK